MLTLNVGNNIFWGYSFWLLPQRKNNLTPLDQGYHILEALVPKRMQFKIL